MLSSKMTPNLPWFQYVYSYLIKVKIELSTANMVNEGKV